jgi:hypothetical protein
VSSVRTVAVAIAAALRKETGRAAGYRPAHTCRAAFDGCSSMLCVTPGELPPRPRGRPAAPKSAATTAMYRASSIPGYLEPPPCYAELINAPSEFAWAAFGQWQQRQDPYHPRQTQPPHGPPPPPVQEERRATAPEQTDPRGRRARGFLPTTAYCLIIGNAGTARKDTLHCMKVLNG